MRFFVVISGQIEMQGISAKNDKQFQDSCQSVGNNYYAERIAKWDRYKIRDDSMYTCYRLQIGG